LTAHINFADGQEGAIVYWGIWVTEAAEGEGSGRTSRSITVEGERRRWRGETSVKITGMEENKETPSSLMKMEENKEKRLME